MGLKPKLLLVAGVLIGMCAFKVLFIYLAPFLAGIFIAALVDPAVDYCERKGCPRPAASMVLVLVVFCGLLLVLAAAAAGIWHEMEQLAGFVQDNYEGGLQGIDTINQLIRRLPDHIQVLIPSVITSISQFVIRGFGAILSYAGKLPALLVSWLMAGMTAFFISRDKREIAKFAAAQLPEQWRSVFFGLKRSFLQNMFSYLKTQLVLMWVTMCIAVSGFLLANHPYAWLLGLLAGFFDLFPLVGPSWVFIPVIVYNLIAGMVQRSVFLAVVWLVLLLVRQMWEPQLVGGEIGLHPLSTMVGIYLGAQLMGVWGLFFGPLALILLKTVFIIVNDST